ncbi:thiolase family protein [Nocardia seriolae]|uniref:Acetyl-CoA C-acetyltransferase n=1 Tax=Nocardia seriolae TaxID=37332 RepID=A0A0B8NN70_9NOCA|nr:thiolase family protein [Nocardia seriolae]APA98620.1 Acetyl-CoA C-acetyltransferase [Nocardia seriolae]MTJ63701.1 acetyl-CoA C-acyltransferase [Nocardia seriolae]MTJ75215.1 acetyl-CoA C-acyltransferase [Nocardia seriolae]MTJ88268.1 acetyl-CoA C-acyltransferase [Nocardia seriolae]MTK32254.1 acetyl-CoA C-acyltransferase [Nocardia seriolae]
MTSAVIVDAVRTPSGKGKTGGGLSEVHPATLLSGVLQALVERTGIDPALVDDVIGGCVTQSGEQAFNISRTAVLAAGFPDAVPATTVDRQCGSSQQAAHFAAQGVMAGAYDIAIACGVESMSRVPMFANAQGRDANRGPIAHRYPDGLVQQGISAEVIAARWKFDRAALDEFAARSHQLAAATAASGGFDNELVAAGTLTADETIRPSTTVEGLAGLKPAFVDAEFKARFPEIEWSITPGNSSPLTDGASAALIMSEEKAAQLGMKPRARFHSFAVTGDDPLLMLTAVIPATRKVLARAGLSINDIDAYEVNEAFAPVPLVWAHEVGADPAKLNPRGGAIALGHPLGASGIRILTTMLNHLEQTGGRYGLMTMCEAGGLANATIIERL